ncbi:MAG: nucleotidyltransferase domain-containing protein [Nitrospiraceae bacterium]|nr:MAG: nucleotidyltransferase domain-containing protein [Nitrospiraceae bacterium]
MSIQELIVKELQQHDVILFAFLFGSYAEDRATGISDIDVGIYTNKAVSLTDIGLMTAHLEKISRKKTDLLILNSLYKTKPVLAFEVIAKGRLIFCRDHETLTEFKKNVFLYFIDTKPLRDMIDRSFRKRLQSGHFGERNYA